MPRSTARRTTAKRSQQAILEPLDTVRVGIYLRRSTDDENQPYSIEAQEDRLRSYVDSQPNWVVALRFADDASGSTTQRKDLQRALTAARDGLIDVLLVYRVDRLSRSLRDTVHLLEELEQAGVVFRSATEPFDTATPLGRMLLQMLAMFAQFERDTIIDRVIAGMERKAAKGLWKGGRRPYGYQVDKTAKKLIIDETEAAIVRLVFDLYVRDRLGTKNIANVLNSRGLRTRNRYNRDACEAPRLDADAVDCAVLTSLATFYRDHQQLIAAAVAKAQRRHRETRSDRSDELTAIETELTQTDQAIDRYLGATRLDALRTKQKQLRHRQVELTEEIDDEPVMPARSTLRTVINHIETIIETGDDLRRKALIEALVAEVKIVGPDRLVPIFKIPGPNGSGETARPETGDTDRPKPTRPTTKTAPNRGAAAVLPATTPPKGAVRAMPTWVEVAGIEPASSGPDTGLLRAHPASYFSAPPVPQAGRRRLSRCLISRPTPRPGGTVISLATPGPGPGELPG